jgi:hypothetical protein
MKKPNQYEDEPEPNQIIGVGSYQSTQKAGKVKTQPIGFIRQKDDTKRKTRTTPKQRNDRLQVARRKR